MYKFVHMSGPMAYDVVQGWYDEIELLSFDEPEKNWTNKFGEIGHFTAMLWPTSTEIGIGVCRGWNEDDYICVCQYTPKGNKLGKMQDYIKPKLTESEYKRFKNLSVKDQFAYRTPKDHVTFEVKDWKEEIDLLTKCVSCMDKLSSACDRAESTFSQKKLTAEEAKPTQENLVKVFRESIEELNDRVRNFDKDKLITTESLSSSRVSSQNPKILASECRLFKQAVNSYTKSIQNEDIKALKNAAANNTDKKKAKYAKVTLKSGVERTLKLLYRVVFFKINCSFSDLKWHFPTGSDIF